MRMKNKTKGFALVETIVCALFVATIFTLLIVQIYPQASRLEKNQYYDDIETKYIAHYLREMIVTDRSWKSKVYKDILETNKRSSLFDVIDNEVKSNGSISFTGTNLCTGTIYKNGANKRLGLSLSNDTIKDEDNKEYTYTGKNNGYYCNELVRLANITRIWFAPYNLTNFITSELNKEENVGEPTAFKDYVRELPTYQYSSKATTSNAQPKKYMWLIVEVKHQNKNTDDAKRDDGNPTDQYNSSIYYSYAKIEVHN